MTDVVNHPSHYTQGKIECIDAMREALGLEGFVAHCRACAIKYSWRAGLKGDTAQDLRKAAWYLNRAADELSKAQANREISAEASEITPQAGRF